ncbi:MAG: restriction endonuclease subunit S [Rhodanobacteraceae bacterium]
MSEVRVDESYCARVSGVADGFLSYNTEQEALLIDDQFVRLGEHVAITKGKPPLQMPHDGVEAVVYLSPEYLRFRADGTMAKAGRNAVLVSDKDSVLLWDGSNAGEFFRARPGLAASTMARLTPSGAFDPSFFTHLVKHLEPTLKSQTNGTGIPHVDRKILEALQLYKPALAQQRVIAQVLDNLDATIRRTEEIIAKLKQVKQGLLHDLLTRGIDANGELRPPQSQGPHLYKPSPLGWIPKQWGEACMSEHCVLITKGTTPAAAHMWQGDEGIRFLRVDNLSFEGDFDFNASSYRIARQTHEGELARSRCIPGDVLTNIVGPPLGKLGLVTSELGEVNVNQAIAIFRPKFGVSPEFLFYWIGSPGAQAWLRSRAKQTSGQVNLTLALCSELPMPCVPSEEQQKIVEGLQRSQRGIALETAGLRELMAMKSGLMDDLLTGRVHVTPLLKAAAAP